MPTTSRTASITSVRMRDVRIRDRSRLSIRPHFSRGSSAPSWGGAPVEGLFNLGFEAIVAERIVVGERIPDRMHVHFRKMYHSSCAASRFWRFSHFEKQREASPMAALAFIAASAKPRPLERKPRFRSAAQSPRRDPNPFPPDSRPADASRRP